MMAGWLDGLMVQKVEAEMLRAIYGRNDRQSVRVTNGIMIGITPILLVALLVIMPTLGIEPSAANFVVQVTLSVCLMCLGFLRAMDIGSGRSLGIFQSIFLLQSVIASIFATSLPMSGKAAVIVLLVTAPLVGYGIGRLCYRYAGATYDG